MKTWKRIFTSILRKPAQSVLMFIIVFVLGNVLFASIAIKQTSKNVENILLDNMSSYLSIKATKFYDDKEIDEQINVLIDELNANEKVQKVNYVKRLGLAQFPLSWVENLNLSDYYVNYTDYYLGLLTPSSSIYDYEWLEGRYYTEDELKGDEHLIVIGDGNAYGIVDGEVRQILHVGDYYDLYFNGYEFVDGYYLGVSRENKISCKIIGIYNKKTIKDEYKMTAYRTQYNGIELPINTVEEIIRIHDQNLDGMDEIYRDMILDSGLTYAKEATSIPYLNVELKGVQTADLLKEDLLNTSAIPNPTYAAHTSKEDYRYVQAPLENLEALANVTLVSSVILVIVLLSLVSILFIRNRTTEIGILMSMGERKRNILIQFAGEILIVGLLATSVAMVSGNYLGNVISNKFIEIQIDVDSEMDYQEENEGAITQLDLLEVYDIEMNLEYIVTIYVGSAIILILSSVAPLRFILKISPKNVML